MYISHETHNQTHNRLLSVIATASIKVFEGAYTFEEFSMRKFPKKINPDALALVRDDEMWSQLVPAAEKALELYKIFRFHFKPNLDNSGFIGWLANHIKTKTGSGVFVLCGLNSNQGGIYDYWGCPLEITNNVLAELEMLVLEGKNNSKESK